MTKRQQKFVHIVGVMLPIMMHDNEKRYAARLSNIDISTILGKAWNVTDRELSYQGLNISDAAVEFIKYQSWDTRERPSWYEGDTINRN